MVGDVIKRAAVLALAAALAATQSAACTGIRLIAEDGSPVFGRTMEFGADVLSFKLVAVPRGATFRGATPDGENGMGWEAEYGYVSAQPTEFNASIEGINEAGLQTGAFFFMPFERARYQDPDPAQYDISLSGWQLLDFLLAKAATVEEVKQLLTEVRVVNSVPTPVTEGWDFEPYIHYAINDATGASIVIEYLDGELHIFDNPLGTITNQPEFPWHLQNLRQYTDLPIDATAPIDREAGEEGPSGLDIGKKADFPGQITSPARFVRAALFSQYALPFADGEEGVQRVLNIMNNFDIPLGYKNYQHVDGRVFPQYTQWTSVTDIRERRIYFRVYGNPQLQMVDLDDIDLSGGEIRIIPVSTAFTATPVTQ